MADTAPTAAASTAATASTAMADVLIVPECDARRGVGHFKRIAFYIARGSLRADILLPDAAQRKRLGAYCTAAVRRTFIDAVDSSRRYAVLIVDTFTIRARDVRRYRRYAPIICALDGRGRGSAYCDYVIDILPRVRGRCGKHRRTATAADCRLAVVGCNRRSAIAVGIRHR